MMKKEEMKNWIATNNYHITISKHIVKKNASGIKTKEENGMIKMTGYNSFIGSSCYEFVSNNFQDEIFNDLCNEVYIALHELIEKDLFEVIDDTPNYKEYTIINKQGEQATRFSYFDLYRTIENFLYSEKKNFTMIQTSSEKSLYETFTDKVTKIMDGKKVIVDVDRKVSVAKNNELTNINANKRIKYYASILRFEQKVNEDDNGNDITLAEETDIPENTCLYENVLQRDEILSYFKYIKIKYPKYYSDVVKIFESLLNGFTYEEIELRHDIKVARIKYLMPIIRKTWNEYTSVSVLPAISDSKHCDTTRNKGTTYYINREKRASVKAIITRATLPRETKSIPLSCGIVDTYDIFKAKFEKNKESDEKYIDNATNYTGYKNVFGIRSNTICVVDGSKILYRLKCSDKAKEVFKEKLENRYI